ncbi:hypothetical protein EDF83_2502 [Pseudomonas protegens]|uniref:hypothetical protein n=1 Tax=Pseudomonas TaxID=286 RepID=UPI000F4A2DB6|nr:MULTISPECIES: hypothetical protein [Pseudomonas]MCS4258764.1 hypothetical protein [Pseudomonas sp. BIGb0176]ROQ58162.1 hypothetical protein EDF83_2502 [Pseudomonas protegens]ROQ85971.1 hypothetical protein EC837_2876 [Pseudomonas protegens]BCQ69620.1 hypothetical protein PEQA60_36100 [Pseudomonas sp. Eqa60]
MTVRKKLYFIGWDYSTPRSVPFKRALQDRDFPWEPVALVHDKVLIDAVDGIQLMTTEDFLAQCIPGQTTALLFSHDEQQRSRWQRRGRDHGIQWVDQGELLMDYAALLSDSGRSRDLGTMILPQAFDSAARDALRAFCGCWPDAKSNQTFEAYLSFLDTGLATRLSEVMQPLSEHPFYQAAAQRQSMQPCETENTLVWEIAPKRTAFLEQAVLQSPSKRVNYAFSAMNAAGIAGEAARLKLLLQGLGISPAASSVHSEGGELFQTGVDGFDLPDIAAPRKWLHLQVDDPATLLQALSQHTRELLAHVRVGLRPTQLLQLLERHPIGSMTLICDRPGPLGLQVTINIKGQ